MWKPVRVDSEEYHKKAILNIAKRQLEKELVKATKKRDKTTEEITKMCPFATSKKRVVAKTSKLEVECQERDEIEKRLQIIEEWKI